MQITVNDRQTLFDIALLALGSASGVFALAVRNGLSVTATLSDGQQLEYEAADIISQPVRDAYELERISPATDMLRAEYLELLYQTGTPRQIVSRPLVPDRADVLVVDKIDQVLDDLNAGRPVLVESTQQLTRIFQDPFDEVFS